MVERPIKKSERQVAPPSDVGEETQEVQPNNVVEDSPESVTLPEKRKVLPSIPGKERSKDRGKGSNKEEAAIPPTNMALMRGPKPTKAKPPIAVTPVPVESSEESESELETDPQE